MHITRREVMRFGLLSAAGLLVSNDFHAVCGPVRRRLPRPSRLFRSGCGVGLRIWTLSIENRRQATTTVDRWTSRFPQK